MASSPSRCRVGDNTKPFPTFNGTATAAPIQKDLAATANKCWCIGPNGVLFSYSGSPFTVGTVNFYSGPNSGALTLRKSFDVTSAGLAPVPNPKVLKFPVGEMVRIELISGGVGVVGKLNLDDYWAESDIDPVE